MNDYLEWMKSGEYKKMAEAEEKFVEEHWAHDYLDSPHVLISMIETKEARAVLAKEQEIIQMLEEYIPVYYKQLSPNSREAKYPIETVIELIKNMNKWSHPEQDFGKPEGKEIL